MGSKYKLVGDANTARVRVSQKAHTACNGNENNGSQKNKSFLRINIKMHYQYQIYLVFELISSPADVST